MSMGSKDSGFFSAPGSEIAVSAGDCNVSIAMIKLNKKQILWVFIQGGVKQYFAIIDSAL
jgi:hypothetical protein